MIASECKYNALEVLCASYRKRAQTSCLSVEKAKAEPAQLRLVVDKLKTSVTQNPKSCEEAGLTEYLVITEAQPYSLQPSNGIYAPKQEFERFEAEKPEHRTNQLLAIDDVGPFSSRVGRARTPSKEKSQKPAGG